MIALVGRLLLFNALDMKFRELKLRRDPQCPICGDHPTIKELIDYDQFCGIQPAPAEPVGNPDEVTVQDMKKALDNPGLGIKVEYGSELTGWQTATAGVNGVTTVVASGIEPGVDEVAVRIPRSLAQGAKFFVRLNVATTP